jgi:hypothetical protein
VQFFKKLTKQEKMKRVLEYLFDENEFLSDFGIRSVSRFHKENPYILHVEGQEHRVDYLPGESDSWLFGGNSNWRGPIWFPMNFLLIEALERLHNFYGPEYKVEFPTRSGLKINFSYFYVKGNLVNLAEASLELMKRLINIFLPDKNGRRACHADDPRFAKDPNWKDLVLFYEYFHGDTGRGLGAR